MSDAKFRIFLLVGGLGTRLAHLTRGVPKAMALVAGRPFLEWQIEGFVKQGFHDYVLLVGHQKEVIMDHFGDGSRWGAHIEYSAEDTPMGTGGAFLLGLGRFPCQTFVLVNGDTYFNIPLGAFVARAASEPETLWIGAKLMVHPERYGVIDYRSPGVIKAFREKDKSIAEGFINGGIYAGSAQVFEHEPLAPFSMESDCFPQLAAHGALRFVAFGEPFIDIGIPQDFALSQTVIPQWHAMARRKALFIDRDGILIEDVGYVSTPEQVSIIRDCLPVLRLARAAGYLLIVITNQAGVAKGKMTLADVELVNQKLASDLKSEGIEIDDFYVCPYHPQGTVAAYSQTSLDRKPEPGMALKAAEKWGIDLGRSVMVGDKDSDILVNTILRSYTIQGRYPLNQRQAITTFSELAERLKQDSQGNQA